MKLIGRPLIGDGPSLAGSGALLVAAVPLVWLLPNHYQPWPTAWQDGLAMAMLCLGALALRAAGRIHWAWWAFATLAIGSVALQRALGLIQFSGDAWMVVLYVAAFLLALHVGASSGRGERVSAERQLIVFAAALVVAAALSAFIAGLQWTRNPWLGIYGAELPPGARPFANLAQANHLCTAAFLGLCGLLLLHEMRRIHTASLLAIAPLLMAAMVASGSRTAWLQLAVASAVILVLRRRCGLRLSPPQLAIGWLLFAVLSWAWPMANEALDLTGSRQMVDVANTNVRWPLWLNLLEAVGRRPWFGYGWQQVVHAQLAVATDLPPLHRHFEHAHSVVIDLLVWVGLPLGSLLTILLALGVVGPLFLLHDGRGVWLMAGVLGLGVHGMLEYPLAYAYFLIPAGFALGRVNAMIAVRRGLELTASQARMMALPVGALLVITGVDYVQVEPNHRLLRLESARIGTSSIESRAPDLMVLTHLEAFLDFARTQAREGMDERQLARFRAVGERFAYPPSMLRLALAEGLNGQPQRAQRTLAQLCSVHAPKHCEEGRQAWDSLRSRYPQLVAFPDTPGASVRESSGS